jgi:ADP-ribosylglycohydrolase
MSTFSKVSIMSNNIYQMLINGAIGDQYGAPIEMMPRDIIRERYSPDQLKQYIITDKMVDRQMTYTDDTQLTIGTLDAILRHGINVTKYDFFRSYLRTFEPSRGYSLKMYNEFTEYISSDFVDASDDTLEKNVKVRESTRNGGLLRVAPIIILLNISYQKGIKIDKPLIETYINMVHYPTHMSKDAIEASVFLVELLWRIHHHRIRTYKHLIVQLNLMLQTYDHTSDTYRKVYQVIDYINNKGALYDLVYGDPSDPLEEKYLEDTIDTLIGLDAVEATETLGIALFSVVYSFNVPNKIVYNTLQCGGDTDTVCCIAGQISGLIFGDLAIDPTWLSNLEPSCVDIFRKII